MKVISILHHSLSPFGIKDSAFINNVWHIRLAKEIYKRTRDYEIECWRPEVTAQNIYTERIEGITSKVFPSFRLRFGREWSYPLFRELRETLQKEEPILIYIFGVLNDLTYSISYFFGKKVPVVAHNYGDDFPWQGLSLALRNRRIRGVGYQFLRCLVEWIPEKLALKNIAHFCVVNEIQRAAFAKLFGADRVAVIPPGVDFGMFQKIDKIEARRELNLDEKNNYILYAGNLGKVKGLDFLLHSFPKVLEAYPDSNLLLAGDGPYRKNLETLCRNLQIEKDVIFLGYIDNARLPLVYNAADVSLLPCLINEGVGLVGVEALACETPFIGTNMGGIPEIINHFKAGLLVPPRSSEMITKAILQCFTQRDSFQIDREGGKAHYSWDSVVRRTLDIWHDLFEKYYGRK